MASFNTIQYLVQQLCIKYIFSFFPILLIACFSNPANSIFPSHCEHLVIKFCYAFLYVLFFSFAFLQLRKEFSSEVDSAIAAFRGISIDTSANHADLTLLFRVAAHEAKKSHAQNRTLRVVS